MNHAIFTILKLPCMSHMIKLGKYQLAYMMIDLS